MSRVSSRLSRAGLTSGPIGSISTSAAAWNGIVYTGGAGSGGTVYAVNESTGEVLWKASVANGDNSSPAVTGDGVYVSYACVQAYRFDPVTGKQIWHHTTGCSGGGGKTTSVTDDRVYARDNSVGSSILDAATGNLLAAFSASQIPAFDGNYGFFLTGSTLEARFTDTNAIQWSWAGDGDLSSAPIVVNGYVYVGSESGMIYALSEDSPTVVWSEDTGSSIFGTDEQNVSSPPTGLAAGEGLLLVPADNRLVAYQ